MLLQACPAIHVIVLQALVRGGEFRHALAQARLEHEGERVGELHRLQFDIAGVLEGVGVRTMRQHGVVQADAAGHEAFGLGVIDAVNEAHEFRHDVAVIPGRPERVFRDTPAFRENHEIDIRGARRLRRRRHHREDRRIGMIEQDRADRREMPQVVFVGIVIAVPGDDIDRRMRHFGLEQLPAPFHEQGARLFHVLVGRERRRGSRADWRDNWRRSGRDPAT